MQSLVDLIRGFFRGVRPWVVIAPWEQGLRVRLGKRVRLLENGVHLRLPWIDQVHIQSVRRRVSGIGKQTITTRDGKTVTLAGTLGYCIEDIELLYRGMHHAEDSIQQMARGTIAQHVVTHDLFECTPVKLEALAAALDFRSYGLGCVEIHITDFAIVMTYRLIGDQQYGAYGSSLHTEAVSS